MEEQETQVGGGRGEEREGSWRGDRKGAGEGKGGGGAGWWRGGVSGKGHRNQLAPRRRG